MFFDKNKNQILDLIFAPCTSLGFFVLSSPKNLFFPVPLSFVSVEKSQQDFLVVQFSSCCTLFVVCYCQNQICSCLILERRKVGVRERMEKERSSDRILSKGLEKHCVGSLVTARALLQQQAKSQIIMLVLSVCRYLYNGNQNHSLDSRNKCFYCKKTGITGRGGKKSVKKSSKSLFFRPTDSIQFSVVSHLCILFAFQYETVT